jgi:hypothetical protein
MILPVAFPKASLAVLVSLFLAAAAAAVDWGVLADERVVEILTTNEDGSRRETKVWLVALEGQGYIRTGSTRWFANIERNPDVVLRAAGAEHAVRTEQLDDEVLIERLDDLFREKYGWSDRFVGLWPGAHTHYMRLVPRQPPGE